MKQIKYYKILISSLAMLLMVSCTKSMETSGDDPALLAFLVNSGGSPDATQAICLGNVMLLNSCVGGADKGDGFSGALCGPNITGADKDFGTAISTAKATTCITTAINDSNCNLPANLSVDFKVALEGPFKDVATCATE